MRRLLAMLMAAILAMTLCTAVSEEETEEVLYYLTSFDCEDLDGNPVDISIFDGAQLVLIDCWEAWCHWCLEEMPDLNELYEERMPLYERYADFLHIIVFIFHQIREHRGLRWL